MVCTLLYLGLILNKKTQFIDIQNIKKLIFVFEKIFRNFNTK